MVENPQARNPRTERVIELPVFEQAAILRQRVAGTTDPAFDTPPVFVSKRTQKMLMQNISEITGLSAAQLLRHTNVPAYHSEDARLGLLENPVFDPEA